MELLLIITAIWLLAASLTDLKKREVADWLSLSLITIAISIRASESIISGNLLPLAKSGIGLLVFFVLANILYNGKIFAGGDAKLLTALGAVISGLEILSNVLVVGGLYGLVYSIGLGLINIKKVYPEIKNKGSLESHPTLIFLIALVFIGVSVNYSPIYLFSLAFIGLYCLQVFSSAVEKTALIKKVSPSDLTEGDWLVSDVRIGKNLIKANFSGLTKKDIQTIRKANKQVYIKYGIPFIPVFLIAFLVTVFAGNIFSLLLPI